MKENEPRVGDFIYYAGREYRITEERRGFLLVGCVGLAFHKDDVWWEGQCGRWATRLRVSCPVPE